MSTTETTRSTQRPGTEDPFARLHRMSTTAGVGSHDYVAVNTPAVVAAMAGVVSFVALFSPVMLVIPAFAAVCAVLSLVQISRSNGTQTGRLTATAGLLLALGFTAAVGYREYSEARAFSASKQEITQIFGDLGTRLKASDHEKAYELFGPAFHGRTKFQDFSGYLKQLEAAPSVGKVKSTEWNERLEAVQDLSDQGNDIARAVLRIDFEKSTQPLNATAMLIRRRNPDGTKGKWVIEQLAPLWETPQQPQQGGPPQ